MSNIKNSNNYDITIFKYGIISLKKFKITSISSYKQAPKNNLKYLWTSKYKLVVNNIILPLSCSIF